jgi:thiol-disulfide isomerase/thioredoxin
MNVGNLITRVFLAAALCAFPPLPAFAEKAIDFQFTDIAGKNLRLFDYRGKWVLVNFWAPWCPLCWVEVPTLNSLNQRDDMVVIGVGMDYGPDEASVKNAIANKNMRYHAQVLGGSRRDPASPFRQVGPVDFYPASYLYDPNGEIVMSIPGPVRGDKLTQFMEDWKRKHAAVSKHARQ